MLLYLWQNTVRCRHSAVSLLQTFSQQAHHSSSSRARYGVPEMCFASWKYGFIFRINYYSFAYDLRFIYTSALWRHSAPCTNCTALKGKKFLLTPGKGNMYWQYCRWDAKKHWLCQNIYYVSLINFVAYNPAISCICRTLPVYIITDASL